MRSSMDMSDNLAAQQADELERDRERLREEGAEQRLHDHRGHSVSTVGRKLKLMFGAGAGAAALLALLALGTLATGGTAGSVLLAAMVVVAMATAAIAVFSMRF